jgi:cytochrome c
MNTDKQPADACNIAAPALKVRPCGNWAATAALLFMGLSCGVAYAQALASTTQPRQWRTPAPGDATRGLALYQDRCTACHAVDSNKTGPAHRGVMGRRVGSLPGYKYSNELAQSRLRWTPQTLNAWLEDPEELVAGQRMGFQVESDQERADLIAYLAQLK